MQILQKGALVLINRAAVYIVAAGGEDKRRFFESFRLIECVDSVDRALQLAGKAVIIHRRRQHEHLRSIKHRIHRLHIVLLDTFPAALCVAVFAGKAARDLPPAHIDHGHRMPCFPCTLCERFHQRGGIAVRPGAAV